LARFPLCFSTYFQRNRRVQKTELQAFLIKFAIGGNAYQQATVMETTRIAPRSAGLQLYYG
jgi:hypothetical protein